MRDDEKTTLRPPLTDKEIKKLEAGDIVEISGTIATARDEAYERILDHSRSGRDLPLNLEGGIIYHCGPLAKSTKDGWEIYAAGPTTSARLDDMEEEFLKETGVKGIIGKGGVGKEVVPVIESLGCIYLAYTGGAAALAAQSIKSIKEVIWEDLGIPEAIWVLEVEKFGPLTVAVDTEGRDLYHHNHGSEK